MAVVRLTTIHNHHQQQPTPIPLAAVLEAGIPMAMAAKEVLEAGIKIEAVVAATEVEVKVSNKFISIVVGYI